MVKIYLLPVRPMGTESECGAVGGRTWGTEAQSTRGAETAASYSSSQWRVFIPHTRLILTGRYQQANVSMQLDQQATLEHPHHHLDQLGLVRSRAANYMTAKHRTTVEKVKLNLFMSLSRLNII